MSSVREENDTRRMCQLKHGIKLFSSNVHECFPVSFVSASCGGYDSWGDRMEDQTSLATNEVEANP